MKTSIIVLATYEWPSALDVVLHALSGRTGQLTFEVVIADDGSSEKTAEVVARWRHALELEHVWQPNEGFLKVVLLNRAVLPPSVAMHLVFLDGDCVPRPRLRARRASAEPSRLVRGE